MARKYRVMIACVTFETVRVSDPVEYYGANKVYLVHYVSRSHPSGVYREFFERAKEIIESRGDVEVVDVDRYVGDFTVMLRTVSSIIQEETSKGAEIYVNLSCGSPEFTAAAATASMMSSGVTAFFAKTGEYQVGEEDVRRVYFDADGRPVGMTRTVRAEEEMPEFSIEMPPEHLVKGLRIFRERSERGDPVTSTVMVQAMRDAGCWTRKERAGGKDSRGNDSVYYQRTYVDRWLEMRWVERNGGRRSGYTLTRSGLVATEALWTGGFGASRGTRGLRGASRRIRASTPACRRSP